MKKTIKVRGIQQIDNAEREWKSTIGHDPINNPAEKVLRTDDKVVVTTVQGDQFTFIIKPKPC